MDKDLIISVIKDPKPNYDLLLRALLYIRLRIQYCIHYNIDMFDDPLLSKVLLFSNN